MQTLHVKGKMRERESAVKSSGVMGSLPRVMIRVEYKYMFLFGPKYRFSCTILGV